MTRKAVRVLGVLTSAWLLACGGGSGDSASAFSTTLGETSAASSGEGGTGGGDDAADFEWTEVDDYELRIDDTTPPPLNLAMDRDEVGDLFGDLADEILLLELDATPLLTNSLNLIKEACGTDWENDVSDPVYDCDLTELGQTFEGPDGTWQTSGEFSALRILTMTPANSRVVGTSIEGMQELADLLNIGGGFSQILSDSMQIPRTTEFLGTQALAIALRDGIIVTHPSLDGSGTLPVTLADALADMATLGEKLGPVANHPGIVDPTVVPYGQMFGEDFEMTAVAESNLKVLDGADLSVSKDFVTVVQDLVGPTFDDPAEFDFENPDKFSVVGLNPSPTIDLRFSIYEHDTFVQSCVGDADCVDNLPGNPVGTASVWNVNPWLLESTIAAAGMQTYGGLLHQQCYPSDFLCTAEVKVGQDPFPMGFAEFLVFLSLGNPPENQYIWELLMEVAQVQFHDNGIVQIAEGEGDISFMLEDIPVGITGDEAAEAVRPYLAEQSSEIADYILGDYKKNNGDVDFYYRRSDDGTPYLYFVTPDDLEAGKPYNWAKPGFFSSAYLGEDSRLSATSVAGIADTDHEKWAPSAGESTAFVQDDEGSVYRLTFDTPENGTTIALSIEKRVD